MGFLKFVGVVLLGYVLITVLAVVDIKIDWIISAKALLALIQWGQQFGFFEIGARIFSIAFVLL